MSQALVLLSLLLSQSATYVDEAELFVDKGQFYVRAGEAKGLAVGQSVEILSGPSKKAAGSATVMEVWDSMARLSLDSKAQAAVGAKRVRFNAVALEAEERDGAGAVMAEAQPLEPALQPAMVKVPNGGPKAPSELAAPPLIQIPVLTGHAEFGGVGPMKRITVYNDQSSAWTKCEVRLANNKRYKLSELGANSSEGMMLFRFEQDGVETDATIDGVKVKCAEGEGNFTFSF